MMTFYEYAAWRRKTTLPNAATLLALAGVPPEVPHEVEVMRLVKAMKRAVERTSPRGASGTVAGSRPGGRTLPSE